MTAELCTLFVRPTSSSELVAVPVTFAVTEAMISNCDAIIPEDVAQEILDINEVSSGPIATDVNTQATDAGILVNHSSVASSVESNLGSASKS